LMAQVITKYVRFIDPHIVHAVVQDNRRHQERWSALLRDRGIDPQLYLWEGSSCCFPGVRRYRGDLEKAAYTSRQNTGEGAFPDALVLDFNEYPKKLCTSILGDSLSAVLHSYSLIHVLGHTAITNLMWIEAPENQYILDKGVYGLFTSPANTIYAPNSLLNTISLNPKLKSLLVERQLRLYRKVCTILPEGMKLYSDRRDRGEAWHIDRFEWAPCFGADFSAKAFLAYRQETMNALFGI
ncbi:MAG: hypothetical protein LBD29_03825, partial [Treponema sp.]|nr:hypothetical protein [Treponema sp.]